MNPRYIRISREKRIQTDNVSRFGLWAVAGATKMSKIKMKHEQYVIAAEYLESFNTSISMFLFRNASTSPIICNNSL